ncbi:hypothetical protein QQY24_03020 [Streptomyces sp. TG1A-8]|uniref:Rv1733c family protein n=1 Tax=Streptomyces sp. TG1A-8 TaxID=3051385 RepID=UPI00265C2527|nr:hypothetical protein [Streptomyces sp. TG1A-8]MDO0924435.1 hypothetical protein [Streptomyces sp. TG1A-8]
MTRTPPTAVPRVRLWRWRRNPLRRHSDIVEAWIVLATWILALLAGTAAGAAVAYCTDTALSARRAQAHPVSAVLTDDAAKTPAAGGGYDDARVWATVRWTARDGSVRTDRVKVLPGTAAGATVTMWADRADRVVPPPASASEAGAQMVLGGALAAQVTGTAVWGAGWLVRTRLVRRRLAEWDEEWKRIGPEWRDLSGGRG